MTRKVDLLLMIVNGTKWMEQVEILLSNERITKYARVIVGRF